MLLSESMLIQLSKLTIIPSAHQRGRWAGNKSSPRLGASQEFADYRAYSPGDDIRQIDWNAYRRTGRPFIKMFFDEVQHPIYLWIDGSQSMQVEPGRLEHSKWMYAIRLAGAIGYIALKAYDPVQAICFVDGGEHRTDTLRSRKGFVALSQFLQSKKALGKSDLQLWSKAGANLRDSGTVWIFSDLLMEANIEPLLQSLRTRGHDVVVVHILSPDEWQPSLIGDLRLIDSELGTAKEVAITRDVLKAYEATLQHYFASIQHACRKYRVRYVAVRTDRSLESVIFQQFVKSGLLK